MQVGRFLGYTAFGSLTFGLVCGQLGVMCLGKDPQVFFLRRISWYMLVLLVLLVVFLSWASAIMSLFLSMVDGPQASTGQKTSP